MPHSELPERLEYRGGYLGEFEWRLFLSPDSLSPPLTSYLISPPPPCDKKKTKKLLHLLKHRLGACTGGTRPRVSIAGFYGAECQICHVSSAFSLPSPTAKVRVYLIWMCEGGRLSAGAVSDSM